MSLIEKHLNNLNWPDKKKSLFSKRKDWWNLASIEITNLYEGFSVFSKAYKDAADILVENKKKDMTSINFLIYPILFLYRHYIELALKELIYAASQYLEEEQGDFNSHDLIFLWEKAKKLILDIDIIDISEDDIKVVENQITQFNKLDKSSMTFRYPVDKKGNLFKNLSDYINVAYSGESCH